MRLTHRMRDERGVAFVEFVVMLPFFLFLIFTMISYGAMFSFRQTLSQAAAEGARAAAVAPAYSTIAVRTNRALQSVDAAIATDIGEDVDCATGDNDGLTCTTTLTSNPSSDTACAAATTECSIAVTLTYAYADHPRIPVPQFFNFALPEHLTYTASARVK